MNLQSLYDNGITFDQYLQSGNTDYQEKHLYYLGKMSLSPEEKEIVLSIMKNKKLLIFSDLFCPDCRVTLTLLENIKKANSLIDYRILSRIGHEEIMEKLSGSARIPLVIDLSREEPLAIYNEIPAKAKDEMAASPLNADHIRLQYRKGAYKAQMLEELIGS